MSQPWPNPSPTPSGQPRRTGMTSLVVGGVVLALAFVIMVMPYGLFVLGGGGDTESFGELVRGFLVTGSVVGAIGLVPLLAGIVMTIAADRRQVRP
ncbi:hypothetical protein ACQHIV_08065 [Kribbella sp. GL6]|uniref:hypothetical protein n=1 Tax=Kribbella sp. GL6 TaxID=3419765 RepID=UPI003CFD842F